MPGKDDKNGTRRKKESNMADQGNSKEVYYFSGGLRCMVLQECHILSTRKLENSRDNNKRNGYKVRRVVIHCVLNFRFYGFKIAVDKVVTL